MSDPVLAPARLEALRRSALLDTPAEEAFDRLARLASRTLNAPVALVSLVDEDRQFLKSCVGLPEPWASRRETPLTHSFCRHAVASGEPLVIEDARAHPLVRESLAIRDLGGVAYAGIPLITREGHALGSFCVIDTQPRAWTEEEIGILRDLAASVITEIEVHAEFAERRKAEEALRASEESYRHLFKDNPFPMWVYDRESLRFLEVNDAAIRHYGYSRDEFLSMAITDIRPVEDVPKLLRLVAMRRSGPGFVPRGEFRHRKRDVTLIDVEVSTQTTTYRGWSANIALANDVTEQRRTEEALRRSEERHRALVRATSQIVWTANPQGETADEQPSWSAFTGQSAEEQRGWGWIRAIHPDDRAHTRQVWTQAVKDGNPYQLEHRVRRHDGEYRHMAVHVVPVQEADGSIREWVGAEADITEKKRAEAAQRFLAEASAILASSLDYRTTLRSVARLAIPDVADHCAVDVIEENREIVRVELALADAAEGMAGKLKKFSSPDWSSPQPGVQAMRSGTPILVPDVDDPWLASHSRGPEHLEALRKLQIRSVLSVPLVAHGRTLGAITLSTGESGRRYGRHDLALAEEIARRASLAIDNARLYRKARQATRAREEIVAVVAHELRSPLNAIRLGLERLVELAPPGTWAGRERAQLDSLQNAAEQTLRLVHDLLDITQIETGHLVVRPSREEAQPLVEDTLRALRPLAAAKSIRLEVQVPEELPGILADRQRTMQVLNNLVENAIRHAPERTAIGVRITAAEREVRFAVADSGPGIPEEHLPYLLGSGWRGNPADGRRAGLGLAIARGIVEAHGGKIWVESVARKGSTFFFTLPAAGTRASSAHRPDTRRDAHAVVAFAEPVPHRSLPQDDLVLRKEAERAREEANERSTRFFSTLAQLYRESANGRDALVDYLRHQISTALYLGFLGPGDRLPSVRQISDGLGAPYQWVVRAYTLLAEERVVEKRQRSGVYVAEERSAMDDLSGETAAWMAGVLAEAFEHQVRVPHFREIVQGWTAGAHLRCACVESSADHLVALAMDVERYFGMETSSVLAEELPPRTPPGLIDVDALPEEVREADLLLTTPFHAHALDAVASALHKPLVVAVMHPEIIAAVEHRVRKAPLTVVCTDPRFADRLRGLDAGTSPERLRTVLADDAAAVAELDPADPVWMTRAAHEHLGGVDLRLLVPLSPSFSPATARRIAEVMIRLNLEGSRR